MISSIDLASLTQFKLSPSSRPIAIIPLRLILEKLSNSIRLILPFLVSIIRFNSCEKLLTGTTAVIFSSCSIGNTLIIGKPFDCLPPSGKSYTFKLYTVPLEEKNNTLSCIIAVKKC